ncbi:hypothetical protein JMUB7542_28010 [Staphylococcus aureus]
MSASLVGSEMCIRDSPITKTGNKNKTLSYRWMASLRETIHPA